MDSVVRPELVSSGAAETVRARSALERMVENCIFVVVDCYFRDNIAACVLNVFVLM